MSSRFDLNGPSFKKQALSLLIIAALLVAGWYAVSAISALIFQSNKYDRQDELDEADYQDLDLDAVYPDPPGFEADFSDLDPDALANMMEWLAGNPEMLEALLPYLDPEDLNRVMYRVYPEGGATVDDMDIWRQTAANTYTGDGWTEVGGSTSPLSEVPDVSVYDEAYLVRFPFGSTDSTELTMPTCYDSPYIESGSIGAENLDSYTLLEDNEQGAKIDFTLNPSTAGNLTYGLGRNNLPSDAELSTGSVHPNNAPQSIKDAYLTAPSEGWSAYRAANPNYLYHYNQMSPNVQAYTTTYQKAHYIRTYLAQNFDLNLDTETMFNRPSEGEDNVDWFLGEGAGLPMDFASAFVLYCHDFGIPARYATGFNSLMAETVNDPGYGGQQCVEITLGNMYAWGEIYYSTRGSFEPMLIMHDGFIGGMIMDPSELGQHGTINIRVDGVYSEFLAGTRYMSFDLTFELNTTEGQSNASQLLELYDYGIDQTLDTLTTDANGYAYYTVTFGDDFTAGAHPLEIKYSMFNRNMTMAVLVAQMDVLLISVSPDEVDVNPTLAGANATTVQANIYDHHNGNPIKHAVLNPRVVDGGSAIADSVAPAGVPVDENGEIDELVTISDSVAPGNYQFRVDFNASYSFENPLTGEPEAYEPPYPYNMYGFSSNTLPFKVNNSDDYLFDMRINGYEMGEQDLYLHRGDSLNFDVHLELQGSNSVGQTVEIYDSLFEPMTPLATLITDGSGDATQNYVIPNIDRWVAGPHKLYAHWVEEDRNNGTTNVVINETVDISVTSFSPSTINRQGTAPTQFSIAVTLTDLSLAIGVPNAQISFIMSKSGFDRTSLFDGQSGAILTDASGDLVETFDIEDTAPLGTYSVYGVFSGLWALDGSETYTISSLSDATAPQSLTVNDPNDIELQFSVNGQPTQESYTGGLPASNRLSRGNSVTFTVRLRQGMQYPSGELITFINDKTGATIGSDVTDTNGYASINPSSWSSTFSAGLMRVKAQYGSATNFTQIFVSETISTGDYTITTSPAGNDYVRAVDTVTVSGYLEDVYGNRIKDAQVSLVIEDQFNTDVTGNINTWLSEGGSTQFTADSNGQFLFQFEYSYAFQGDYDIHVSFDGVFYDDSASCPGAWTDLTMNADSNEMANEAYAGLQLTAYFNPNSGYLGVPITVWGDLTYDDGSALGASERDILVKFEDPSGTVLGTNDSETWIDSDSYETIDNMIWEEFDNDIFVEFQKDTVNHIEGLRVRAIYQSI